MAVQQSSTTASPPVIAPSESTVWMEHTRYSATLLMHSQDRNIHSKIFGGHLMRQSLEIAWTNAILFAGALACVRVFKPTQML
jgi:acyl-CoA hydrolase